MLPFSVTRSRHADVDCLGPSLETVFFSSFEEFPRSFSFALAPPLPVSVPLVFRFAFVLTLESSFPALVSTLFLFGPPSRIPAPTTTGVRAGTPAPFALYYSILKSHSSFVIPISFSAPATDQR